MARPIKDGVDYFPFDVSLDEKFELMEAEFGLTGFAVVVKLFQRIYSRGYYCEWTNEVALLFSRACGLGGNVVSEIVAASIKRGIFNKEMYDKYLILTSVGIQKRYFEAVSRRKQINVNKSYLLINIAQFLKSDVINWINVDINPENECDNSQSKVEESKVKKSSCNTKNSSDISDSNGDNKLSPLGGKGKGIVMLSEQQINALLDELTLEEFDFYTEKLADFIIDKNAKVKSHYQTILKWVRKDRET